MLEFPSPVIISVLTPRGMDPLNTTLLSVLSILQTLHYTKLQLSLTGIIFEMRLLNLRINFIYLFIADFLSSSW